MIEGVKMYTLKLVGPNAGKTIRIRDYQFVEGICKVSSVPQTLIKYYGAVVDDGKVQEQETKEEVTAETVDESPEDAKEVPSQAEEDNGQAILRQVIEAKKREIETKEAEVEPTKYKTQEDFKNFFEYKAYVVAVSGVTPKNKKDAIEIMSRLK
jgi:hypothetical protein